MAVFRLGGPVSRQHKMEPATEPMSPAVYSPTSTPILDVLRPLPKGERWKLSAGEIFFLSSSFIFSLIIAQAIGPLPVDVAKPAALISVLLAGLGLFGLAVVVHEIGHFLLAWLAGFRLVRESSGELGGLSHKLSGSEVRIFGLLRLHPMKMENLRHRLLLISAGGPLASLLVAVVVEEISFSQPAWLINCVHFLAACSVLLGVAALLPDLNRSGKFSDGARMLMLAKNDTRAQGWLTILQIQCAWTEGKLPHTWPQSWIDSITSCDDSSRDAINGQWLAYLWAMERQDVTRATSYLETALEMPVPVLRPLRQRIHLEAAIFQAWFRENSALAQFWDARLHGTLSQWQRQRLQTALLWAEGQLFDAQEKLTSYLADLAKLPESPERSFAESGAREWKRQMESRMLTRAWRSIYSMSQQVESATDALPVPR
ncbi:MAG TPA: hypothetical protein VJN64_03465 [Terriglobales bacterium]|nr:hypothetical protein [Terriglobales bacterium]